MAPGQHTFAEITGQHASWHDAIDGAAAQVEPLRELLSRYAAEPLLFVACGSPYFLGRSAAVLAMRWLGRRAVAVPSSELILYPDTVLAPSERPLMVAFSRSGETSETIGAARIVQGRGGALVAIGCDRRTTLMGMADCVIELPAGREQSLAQTRSFSGMFLSAVAAMVQLSDQPDARPLRPALARLPALGEAFVRRADVEIGDGAADPGLERVIYLGGGVRFGLACEAALKMQEMSLTNATAFHVLEYRHGPMALADERTLVVGLIGDEASAEELDVLREAQAYGARTLALLEQPPEDRAGLDAVFAFESGLPAALRDLLYLPPVQLLAYRRALAKGVDPDTSRNIQAFIHRPSLAGSSGDRP
jgi:glutamine---fructose-6-phosphate transaminase (isomerizing)